MKNLLFLAALIFLTYSSCDQEQESLLPTCDPEVDTCLRVVNNTGILLRNIKVSMNRGDTFTDYSVLSNGGESFYLPIGRADFCNFEFAAKGSNDTLYVSGNWICSVADPLQIGLNTLKLTSSDLTNNRLWAEIERE